MSRTAMHVFFLVAGAFTIGAALNIGHKTVEFFWPAPAIEINMNQEKL